MRNILFFSINEILIVHIIVLFRHSLGIEQRFKRSLESKEGNENSGRIAKNMPSICGEGVWSSSIDC
ncbi:hypothetical protein A7Q10_03635 [Methylacidiphilum caldifontis]|uniref:Uncharacterized protein n=1 Tax=Methylacidiphilum caldifontis TaxID=2795386 RepID=A0A4Y8PHG6_9BACT|nr:hypothetical protein A7Q10_03635 [Methylacidiphilum caldifontis]